MSTFSGLGTALSSLIAQRQALEVAGQNMANANTAGYTRQRTTTESVSALSAPSMFSTPQGAGNGVRVTGITRMDDAFLDARLRATTSSASFQNTRAAALGRLEASVTEPGTTGPAAALSAFWAAWQGVGNNANDPAAREVLLGDARALVTQVSDGYRAVQTQWTQTRTQAEALVADVNTTATAIAELNDSIRSVLVAGGSANELMDRRDQLVTTLSGLVGATGRERADGTMDVVVGGNMLVRGTTATSLVLTGSREMAGGIGQPPSTPDPVAVRWADGTPLPLEGGAIAGHLATLAPASSGGLLADAANAWDDVARTLHDAVNAIHAGAQTPAGAAGGDFFTLGAGQPAALGLSLAVTDAGQIAAGDAGKGAFDGSVADRISQLATASDGPDASWRAWVVDLGVTSRSAAQRAAVTETTRATAENLQLSQASVDLDEESVNMLAFQRAYEGAARVLTAIDEMLDVLINRTGVVGR
ncbi:MULTISPECIES: flagellar hook-associated protein FlgK [unclassified Actinotalea]|uniref:flagellar hook-associated protein FlgK n=1 Tax=unclassified Actinotalea TaxID=2638618 RepID=UPI0015F492DB|nr:MULTISPECIES: flagellar hook-associated protein FlgK [unclassified Actinotalea]